MVASRLYSDLPALAIFAGKIHYAATGARHFAAENGLGLVRAS
jgi:hypothetical protein